MKTKVYLISVIIALCIYSCKEGSRFEVNSEDKTPPDKPRIDSVVPLYGGARFFYTIPENDDLLSINAEYTNANGKTFYFSASYFVDSLDVIGLGDTLKHTITLYAVDRAGNKSEPVIREIVPLESTISRVIRNLTVKPGFGALMIDWDNELERSINVYIYFKYTQNGALRDLVSVFSSNKLTEKRFISNLVVDQGGTIEVEVRVEDMYENTTDMLKIGNLTLQEDYELSKSLWTLPNANDSIAGVPMMFGSSREGKTEKVIDGVIDRGDNLNFLHTGERGRTGLEGIANQNMPWNLIIDMGDYYELSRIITHQRHHYGQGSLDTDRGQYYKYENVGYYAVYILNETTNQWDSIMAYKIPVPIGISDLEYVKLGQAGDMAYFYPEAPQYTPRARWFRYEALNCFDDNYSSTGANCLSEITLYGRKAK